MRDIFEKIKSLFNESLESKRPLIHETIERSEAETTAANVWLEKTETKALFEKIAAFVKHGQEENTCFHLFKNEHSKSFVLYFEESELQAIEMQYYFDSMKNLLLEQSYYLYMSDRRIIPEPDSIVKTIERHYLKAAQTKRTKGEKREQEYGNIAIELHLRDSVPEFVKLTSSYYQDHLYKEVKPFSDLLQRLFK